MRKLNTILISSITILIWIDYVPLKLPSLVEKPEKFEFLIYNLALAYVASYIFYYINQYLPERKNSKAIKKVINNNVLDIIQYRKLLINIKNNDFNINRKTTFQGKDIAIEDFIKKIQKDLNYNVDTMLTIKERLPTELLNYTLLLKRHPYFDSTYKDFERFDKYVDAYDLLSNKLYMEFKKL